MRNTRYVKGNPRVRQLLVREAARLMYEEHVKQYHDAKRMAAKRIFGQGSKGNTYVRSQDLPSNGEINDEVAKLANFHEGDNISKQLFLMRVTALDVMQTFESFNPRLIGSVSTGNIKKSSDIDVHLFLDHIEQLEMQLAGLSWDYERNDVTINRTGKYVDYTHFYLEKQFPIELSVYHTSDIRVRTRSSTDGKPIKRISSDRLLQMLLDEHGEEWSGYLQSGA